MRPLRSRGALAAALLLAAGCRHGSAAAGAAAPSGAGPAWPAPPEAPRLRLLAGLEVGAVAAPPRSALRDAVDWLAGATPSPADHGLGRPVDVAYAPDGSLLVADAAGPRVLRFAASGRYAADLSCEGLAWTAPTGVAAEGDLVFVADPGQAAVVQWSAAGCRRLGQGALARPTGLALAPGLILVADPAVHQVVVLRRDGSLAARWGAPGSGEGQLHAPVDVAAAPDGTALVVDAFNFRVARFGADGAWLGSFGAPGAEGAGLLRPKGIAAGPDGTIYLTDADRDAILVFDRAGGFVVAAGSSGTGPGQLSHPAGLAVGGARLAVADSLNRRIQVFEVLGARP